MPTHDPSATAFRQRLLSWYQSHGRKALPWQHTSTAYSVWVSEIMLQQTQVSTVIPYYERFMARFPEVQALAAAPLDEVLHLWSGLGYYARARNLHRAAQEICAHHGGHFPTTLDAAMSLPGIGRSTAGAVLAFANGQPHPILDGNVKRVLTRLHAIEGWPGRKDVEAHLWALAARYTPQTEVAAYTQAIMDLGATLCTRARPRCTDCPMQTMCAAYATGQTDTLPTSRPRAKLPVRTTAMLMLENTDGAILLQRRPPAGVWGGLWAFPECPADADPRRWCREQFDYVVTKARSWPTLRHTFSHFHLDITPVHLRVHATGRAVMESAQTLWYNPAAPEALGLAAPVQRLLAALTPPKDTIPEGE